MSGVTYAEVNIDALVGPTHHFGGLGVGNLASLQHAHQVSRPREAALEGLQKASLVASLGVPQYLFLPPVRPRLDLLSALGFEGDLSQQLGSAYHTSPYLLSAASSSAFMWAANSATVSAAADSAQGCLQITPANLISSWHRAGESLERKIDFHDFFERSIACELHAPLPAIMPLRDEGAANHMRLCDHSGQAGFNVFVYGDSDEQSNSSRFFARQTRAASEAIARKHQLDPRRTFFLQQHPDAIAAGVFHNDVIATSHENLLIYHQTAFLDAEPTLAQLAAEYLRVTGKPLLRIEVTAGQLSLNEAVASYFFNSQILSPQAGRTNTDQPKMVLICPSQCSENESARHLIDRLIAMPECPIEEVQFVSLAQSMANGGGPACLRLRVPIAKADLQLLPKNLRVDAELVDTLSALIERWYPQTLTLSDLSDAELVRELSQISFKLRLATDSW